MYKMGIYSFFCHAAKGQVGKIKQKIRNIWELLGGTEEQRDFQNREFLRILWHWGVRDYQW